MNVEKEDVEMKVDIVEFVENEMVELDVAQIGLNWGWSGDESEFGDVECGDGCGDGYAEDITKVYDSVNKSRLGISGKLKGIARITNDGLDDYECGIIGRDYNDSECNDETKAD